MSIELSTDKVYNYLKSRLFPWNFLLEPVDDAAIEHYMKLAIPRAVGLLRKNLNAEKVIADEVRKIANDFLIDPNNEYAQNIHGKFADAYPFAYAQCMVYAMLCWHKGEFSGLEEVTDIKMPMSLIGVGMTSLKNKERLIQRLMHQYKDEMIRGVLAKGILNRQIVFSDGTPLGTVYNIIVDIDTSYLHSLVVELEDGIDPSKFKKIGDGPYVQISIHSVRLSNVYNDYIIYDNSKIHLYKEY
ncbi:MAG: PRC-barrel domain-containing protein [Methanocellales archaeon]|nr:PRC-barrel domain-containing protein [Methanocellales archaeon]